MALPTQKMQLTLQHVPTGHKVSFPAYIEMFSDQYSSNWNAEDVYGRMDPIATFVNTRRAISLAWNVPAESYDHAKLNLEKVNKLMSFLYPLYEEESEGGATAINQAPLLRVSFGNLIRDAKTGRGLLGYVNGFTFDPAVEFGMFHNEPKARSKAKNVAIEYYPKTFRVNFELNVLHEHSLGFKRSSSGTSFSFTDEKLSNTNYPYATSLTEKATKGALSAGLLPSLAALNADDPTLATKKQTSPVTQATTDGALNKGST